MFNVRTWSPRRWAVVAVAAVIGVYMAVTCNSSDPASACETPEPGTQAYEFIETARDRAGFELLYPCYLPNAQALESTAVIGEPGRQQASFVWTGPFDLTVRQSQYPPAASPDPAGVSRRALDLFPNVRAEMIERNDGSGDAMYHLFWQQEEIYYELQAFGPSQQQRIILRIARSLE